MSSTMSGESGRSTKTSMGQQVRPEPVVEKTFVENVAGFINEVAPQTYSNPSHYEGKETISWVRFDYCDINDLAQFRDKIEVNGNSPPLLLIIGYVCGVQAWVIPVNGEAMEVLSWRQGAVRTLKVLPTPITSCNTVDLYSLKRPLIALCDTAGPGPQFCSVTFISLKTGEQVKTIKFKHPVHDIHANKNVIVISFPEKLAVFDAATIEDKFTVTTCYPCPGPSLNPIALGDRWLAYADRRMYPLHQSCGGMVPEGATSYKATVFHAAKSLTKGLKELGESVASNLMGQRAAAAAQQAPPTNMPTPGIVTVLDTQLVGSGEISLLSSGTSSGIVAHFSAHHGAPIVALSFDPTGMLLLTADKQGHNFHLFRLQPHPLSAAQSAVHHLYTLHRGDTTAKVIDISFSLDARWVAVSTHRGTTHVFPITPYGGHIGVRTHTSSCVVNRLSRFQRSAGLDDTPSSGRNSPVLSASPSTSKFVFEPTPNLAYPNPRYPPYPTPHVIKPLVQLRQPLLQNLIGTISSGPSPSRSPPTNKATRSPSGDDVIKVASVFASPRGWLAGSPTVPRDKQRRTMDSLFVMAYHGNLLEYHLEPHAAAGIPQDRVTEDSPIELEVHASAQWALVRESTSGEMRPPLELTSPLLAPLSPTRPRSLSPAHSLDHDDPEERWMAQVEIHTHAGPHRRLWMGPQFTFKSIPGIGVGYGGGFGQNPYESPPVSASSVGRPPRSSPVNMPGAGGANVPVLIEAGSLTGSHDQSPRLMERYSGDSDFDPETMMTQLRHDLADAMMDTQISGNRGDTGEDGAMTSQGADEDDSALDMTDVMDINCEPPGPSSTRVTSSSASPSLSRVSSRPSSHIGEEVQAVTTRLHQVAVTHPDSTRSSPLNQRTSSLEDNRALTSSAEELSSTLVSGFRGVEPTESVWVPIDPPPRSSYSQSPEFVQVSSRSEESSAKKAMQSSKISRKMVTSYTKHADNKDSIEFFDEDEFYEKERSSASLKSSSIPDSEPTSSHVDSMTSSRNSGKSGDDMKSSCSSSLSSSKKGISQLTSEKETVFSTKADFHLETIEKEEETFASSTKVTTTSAWGRTSPIEPFSLGKSTSPKCDEVRLAEDSSNSAPMKASSTEVTGRTKNKKKPSSTTTSEDDLWVTTESKKDKKKKKKKSKIVSEDESEAQVEVQPAPARVEVQPSPDPVEVQSTPALVEVEPAPAPMEVEPTPAPVRSKKNAWGISESNTKETEPEEEEKSTFEPKVVPNTTQMDIDIEADYFHTAEEYHETEEKVDDFVDFKKECFQEPQAERYEEAQDTVTQNLEDFEITNEVEVTSKVEEEQAMLRSMHDDNDLAKALEEAYSSDDSTPVITKTRTRTHSRSRPSRTSEMFPFKDETSDDEEAVQLRRRVVVSATVTCSASRSSGADETSTDERGETSGDDRGESSTDDRRTATSESDVGASPNPRATSTSKKKKKKRR